MTLEEKALPWISHHLNTRAGEHITPEYFSINPNGLVPTLVHDGDVWIESADIIRYLDETYPEPALTPSEDKPLAQMSEWMSLASAIHVAAVKTYVYSARRANNGRKSTAELKRYRSLQTNKELLSFHTRNSSDAGLGEKDRSNAEHLLHAAIRKIEKHLDDHSWLAGDAFTLADITWVPLHYTLERSGFNFDRYSNVKTWASAIASRSSFQKGVVQWSAGPSEAGG